MPGVAARSSFSRGATRGFDALVMLFSSFGYFDDEGNRIQVRRETEVTVRN